MLDVSLVWHLHLVLEVPGLIPLEDSTKFNNGKEAVQEAKEKVYHLQYP